ncbi:MAG: hypothetical protein PHT59_05245 [Candidatus Omnitrophica bacterium]|nr:hypothetical protein [Candidatus Omnitrophota bacterium]
MFILLFGAGIVIVAAAFTWFLSKKGDPLRLGVVFAALHFLFTLFVWWMAAGMKRGGESPMWAWLLCLVADFPLYPLMAFCDTSNTFLIWLFFATLGTVLYFFVGWGVGKVVLFARHMLAKAVDPK